MEIIQTGGALNRHKSKIAVFITMILVILFIGSCLMTTASAATPVLAKNVSIAKNFSLVTATPTPTATINIGLGRAVIKATPTPTSLAVINRSLLVNLTRPVTNTSTGGDAASPRSLVYVTATDMDQIQVIDAGTNAILSSFAAGKKPWGISASPDGTRLYISNYMDGTVSVIKTADNSLVQTIPVGKAPVSLAITPDGTHVYVANYGDNTTSDIATASNTVVGTYVTGHSPVYLAINPRNGDLYVNNDKDKTVSVIRSGKIIATISVKSPNGAITITPDGKYAYLADSLTNTVSIIDTSTNSVVNSVVTGSSPYATPYGIVFTKDGSKAYVSNLANQTVVTLDTSKNTVVSSVKVNYPGHMALSSDGKSLYVIGMPSNNVSVVNLADNSVKVIGVPGYHSGIAVATEGSVASAGQDLSETTGEPADLSSDVGVTASPDQSQASEGSPGQSQSEDSTLAQGPSEAPSTAAQVTQVPAVSANSTESPAANNKVVSISGFESMFAILGILVAICLFTGRRN